MSGRGCKFGWSELRGVREEGRHHRTEGAMRERRQKVERERRESRAR
jgi:hypothetical protein